MTNSKVLLKKAVETYGVSSQTFYKWQSEGKIRFYRMGGRVFIDVAEFESAMTVDEKI